MSPFQVLIPITFLLVIFLLFSKGIKYRHERKKLELMRGEAGAENSLTTTELQLMIDDAVARATVDLEARLEMLERPLLEGQSEEPYASKTLGREPAR